MDGILTNIEFSDFTNPASSQTSTTGNQISNGLNFAEIPIESNWIIDNCNPHLISPAHRSNSPIDLQIIEPITTPHNWPHAACNICNI